MNTGQLVDMLDSEESDDLIVLTTLGGSESCACLQLCRFGLFSDMDPGGNCTVDACRCGVFIGSKGMTFHECIRVNGLATVIK